MPTDSATGWHQTQFCGRALMTLILGHICVLYLDLTSQSTLTLTRALPGVLCLSFISHSNAMRAVATACSAAVRVQALATASIAFIRLLRDRHSTLGRAYGKAETTDKKCLLSIMMAVCEPSMHRCVLPYMLEILLTCTVLPRPISSARMPLR